LGTVIMRRLDQRHRIPRKTGATETRASGKHALSHRETDDAAMDAE
jgi:hypothetical protein